MLGKTWLGSIGNKGNQNLTILNWDLAKEMVLSKEMLVNGKVKTHICI